jgi:hypothetical protein
MRRVAEAKKGVRIQQTKLNQGVNMYRMSNAQV